MYTQEMTANMRTGGCEQVCGDALVVVYETCFYSLLTESLVTTSTLIMLDVYVLFPLEQNLAQLTKFSPAGVLHFLRPSLTSWIMTCTRR